MTLYIAQTGHLVAHVHKGGLVGKGSLNQIARKLEVHGIYV